MRLLSLLFAAALLLGGRLADADAPAFGSSPYSSSLYREGPGFKIGETPLVVHLGLAVELGYDSNVFYAPTNETGSGLLRARLHLDLATLPPQRLASDLLPTADPKVDFRLSTQFEYREYLSPLSEVRDLRSFNVAVIGDLTILPAGPFTLKLNDTYLHAVDARSQDGSLPLAPGSNWTRNYNRVGVLATYKVGATRRLQLGLGDWFEFSLWEDRQLQFGNVLTNEGQAFVRWSFRPKIIGNLTLRAAYHHFPNNNAIDSAPIRALAGISAVITNWFGFGAQLGYGNSIQLGRGPSFNSAVAQVEARFYLPLGSKIFVGYDRDFFDTLFANYYVDDHLYVRFEQPLVRRLLARLDAGVRFREFAGLTDPTFLGQGSYSDPNGRKDFVYEVGAELAVRAASWLEVGAAYNLRGDRTDFAFISATGVSINASYIKHSVLVRADIAY